MAKWLLAYVITLLIFPRLKPYLKGIIDNEYVLDIGLGISIFVVVIFFVLLINKGLSKAIRYTGIGSLDTVFGFFFGFIRALINPKKNPNTVSKLPIPVYLIALLSPLLINKTKNITTTNIEIPRPISNTYSLSIIPFKYGFNLGKINKVMT